MGTHYQLDVCQQCLSLPGRYGILCMCFQHLPCYLRSSQPLAKAATVSVLQSSARGGESRARLCMQRGLKCALWHLFFDLDLS